MGSGWYRDIFPMMRFARNRASRHDFETTRGGGRYSASVGGALTGRGGDLIIFDDPHKPDEAQSAGRRTSVLDWYKSTLLSRCNDPVTTPIILIQLRIHECDLAGMLLEQGGWKHLNLPAIAEEAVTFDLGGGRVHRREEGDLLHADRLPRDLLDAYKVNLGSYVFAAQYQQRPAPVEGGIVKWAWFKLYDAVPALEEQDEIVQSWDTALTASDMNDCSVCTTWLVRQNNAWLIDLFRGRLEYPDLTRKIQSLAGQWFTMRVNCSPVNRAFNCQSLCWANTAQNWWSFRGSVQVEQSHRSDQQEFYQLLTYKGGLDLEAKLDEWERFCNFARPHGAHNGQTPYEVLRDRLTLTLRCPVGSFRLHSRSN